MSEADGIISDIDNVIPRLQQVVANGSLASKELTEALLYLGMVEQKLISSREFAHKEIEHIDEALSQLARIFESTFSDSVRLIIRDLEKTSELLNNYVDRLGFKISDLNKLFDVIKQNRGDEEMYASSEPMLRAILALEEYRNRL